MRALPLRSNWILCDERVWGEQHTIVLDGLADEHAIKGIAMQRGKLMEVEYGLFMERECRNPMPFPLLHYKTLDRTGQGQLSKGMFHGEFPHRYDTEQHLVGRICEQLPRSGREFVRTCDDPQECAGVE